MNAVVTNPVTMVYHELRSPLALLATAACCAAAESADDYVRSRCESIVRVADRMLRTAAQVIDMASASQASEECVYVPAEVVEAVVADYRELGVNVAFEGPGERAATVGAPLHLEALISSLVGNANDHGDPSVPLVVSVANDRERCTIGVRNAIGSRRDHRGLGLGSYISSQLATFIGAQLTLTRSDTEHIATVEIPLRS